MNKHILNYMMVTGLSRPRADCYDFNVIYRLLYVTA